MSKFKRRGWIGFDLDGTLAYHNSGDGVDTIGDPIPKMVERVKNYINRGYECRIVTARVAKREDGSEEFQRSMIRLWTKEHIGQHLVVTNAKDYQMLKLYDDRAVQVIANTGMTIEEMILYNQETTNNARR